MYSLFPKVYRPWFSSFFAPQPCRKYFLFFLPLKMFINDFTSRSCFNLIFIYFSSPYFYNERTNNKKYCSLCVSLSHEVSWMAASRRKAKKIGNWMAWRQVGELFVRTTSIMREYETNFHLMNFYLFDKHRKTPLKFFSSSYFSSFLLFVIGELCAVSFRAIFLLILMPTGLGWRMIIRKATA